MVRELMGEDQIAGAMSAYRGLLNIFGIMT